MFKALFKTVCTSLGGVAMLALCATGSQAQDGDQLHLIALGDLPYGYPEEVYPAYEALIDAINANAPDLVIHVGDTKGGGACSDTLLQDQLEFMTRFTAPLLYTPGDNEWTDCHRWGDDPLDRLNVIRALYFADPARSLGDQTLSLQHQGAEGYPENAKTRIGGIGILTAHIVGSNNNFEARDMAAVEEFFARSEASTKWMTDGFSDFSDADIIVLAIHADMFEFDFNEFDAERWLRHSGFRRFGEALKSSARTFGRPVLLIFGDSHRHRIFQPFPKNAPNVTAMEVYGYPDQRAVSVLINPDGDVPFKFEPIWNPLFDD